MNYIFQNLGPPDANLPNEFDQVYSDDQIVPTIAEDDDLEQSSFAYRHSDNQ
ncbi:hypothetical protein RND71_037111 [Anisodus tanguticus]|uniref:Uncharacterized protein n=1 Tax=Anisodus tanguticus TaxID=243964 RepID=A0AAE1UUR7_9SOLA|nr:hypothetical protein RND71_037111 [Anisodus tanguticus]